MKGSQPCRLWPTSPVLLVLLLGCNHHGLLLAFFAASYLFLHLFHLCFLAQNIPVVMGGSVGHAAPRLVVLVVISHGGIRKWRPFFQLLAALQQVGVAARSR